MQQLTVIYKEILPDVWNGTVQQYPNIVAYKIKTKEEVIETMYHLITEELFYKTKSLNSWSITREIYVYFGAF